MTYLRRKENRPPRACPPRVHNKRHHSAPDDAINIMRPSVWGNPYPVGPFTRDEACERYEREKILDPEFIKRVKQELRGKHLVCCCHPLRCHGDFLFRIANE